MTEEEKIRGIVESLKDSNIIEYDNDDKTIFYLSKKFMDTFLETLATRIEKNLEEGISKSQINTKKLLMMSLVAAISYYKERVTLDEVLAVDHLVRPAWGIIENKFFKKDMTERILDFLKTQKKSMTSQEISAGLNVPVKKIYVPLRRLLKRGNIDSPKRGVYQTITR